MHNLRAELFFKPRMVNWRVTIAEARSSFLCAAQDSPPYLHDGRC